MADDNRHDPMQSDLTNNKPRAPGRRWRRRDAVVLGVLGALTTVGGCTFINSFDDLKARSIGVDTGGVADIGDTLVPPTDTPGADTPIIVDPAKVGLIVEGAEVADKDGVITQVLTVIDPLTGTEFAGVRENMTVVNVMYDAGRDAWYIFENTTASDRVQPAPADAVTLHVREWDYNANKWKADTATVTGLPTPFTRDAMAVITEEIAYAAFTGTGSTTGLVLVRTDDLTHPTQIGTTLAIPQSPNCGLSPKPPCLPIGVVGARKNGGSGGNVAVIRYGLCASAGKGCTVELLHYTAPATFGEPVEPTSIPVVATLDTDDSNPSFGTGTDVINSFLIGTPFPSATDMNGSVLVLNPDTLGTDKTARFATGETQKFLRAMAVDECDEGVVFIPELLSQKVHVIPLAKPDASIDLSLGNPGQRIAWEPYTRTMLAPVKQGVTSAMAAWKVSIDAGNKTPTLTRRGSDWKYDSNLRPNVVTPKAPTSAGFDCTK